MNWSEAIARLRPVWRTVLLTHLAYTGLGLAILAPLLSLTSRLVVAFSGSAAVSDQEIAYFLLSPVGLTGLTLMLALSIILVLLEQASLMGIGLAVSREKRLAARDAVAFALYKGAGILSYSVRLVARILIIVLPFLAAGAAVAWFLITDHDINFYLSQRPPEFVTAAALIGVIVLGALAVLVRRLLDWSMALPLVVFGGASPKASFAESTRRIRGRRMKLLGLLCKWAVVTVVLGVLVTLTVRSIARIVLPLIPDRVSVVLPVLGVLVALWAIASILVTAFNAGSFAQIILGTYERCGPVPPKLERGREFTEARRQFRAFTGRRIAIGLIALVLLSGGVGVWLLKGMQVKDHVEIVAHRGAAGAAPENTMAAIRRAMDDGADWVEIDVQETADGEVIVIHDSDFMKLSGVPLKVWDGTLEEIQNVDIGSWFAPVFSAERVPTLRDVLTAARDRAKVVIELKYYGHDERLEERVVEIVESENMADQVAIMSLKYEGIQKIRALRPDWNIGLLSAKALGDLTKLDADFLAVNMGIASSGFLRRARKAGKPVLVWTVNTPVDISRMTSLGVDGIITDEPAMARGVLEDRADMSVAERLLAHTAVVLGRPPPKRSYRDESP